MLLAETQISKPVPSVLPRTSPSGHAMQLVPPLSPTIPGWQSSQVIPSTLFCQTPQLSIDACVGKVGASVTSLVVGASVGASVGAFVGAVVDSKVVSFGVGSAV